MKSMPIILAAMLVASPVQAQTDDDRILAATAAIGVYYDKCEPNAVVPEVADTMAELALLKYGKPKLMARMIHIEEVRKSTPGWCDTMRTHIISNFKK
jgi:hypothetical protein